MPFSEETLTRLKADAEEITGRYPRARSAVLPLLYLVQAEEGYVSDEGMAFCAEVLGITQTEVRGVASFFGLHTTLQIFIHFHGEVRADFVVELAGDFFGAKNGGYFCEVSLQAHDGSPRRRKL